MKNILFLVHIEKAFKHRFPKNYETTLVKACLSKRYDEVIILVSGVTDIEPINEVKNVTNPNQWIEWGWGYSPRYFKDNNLPLDEKKWLIKATGFKHNWTWIPPFIRNRSFHGDNIFVGGGGENQCLQDFLDILNWFGYSYKKVKKYIY